MQTSKNPYMRKDFLRSALAKESRAYGFTIAFWGSGALLIKAHDLPNLLEAFSYGTGAILGFGLMAFWAYRRTLGAAEYEENDLLVLSMLHYIGSLLPIGLTYFISQLPSPQAFLLSGAVVSVGYNFGMIAEEVLCEEAAKLEEKLIRN